MRSSRRTASTRGCGSSSGAPTILSSRTRLSIEESSPRAAVEHLHPDRLNVYWLGPYRHGVSYWIAGGRLLAMNCAVQDAAWSQESWTLETDPAEAAEAFAGWDPRLVERIHLVTTTLRGAVFVRSGLEHWSSGRATLLGDAAHAMEPFQAQGAAQAVEDAYVAGGVRRRARRRRRCIRHLRTAPDRARRRSSRSRRRPPRTSFTCRTERSSATRDAHYATLLDELPFGTRQPIWEYDVRDALVEAGVV